jgi:hypothetical protein
VYSVSKVLFLCLAALILFSLPGKGTLPGFLGQQEAHADDFVVSNDVTEGLRQNYPATATDRTGHFVIVWQDERSGWGEFDIYAQLYNLSGVPQGTNFKVNTDVGTTVQEYPSVSMDQSGNFVVVWADWRNDNSDIYAQRFNSSGGALGVNFRVDDDTTNGGQYAPDVVMNYNTGSFVITWRDERNEDEFDVLAQRFKPNGDTLGEVLKVNDQFIGTSSLAEPAIAMDDSGKFAITWADSRYDDYDVYVMYYDYNGLAWGVNNPVIDDGAVGNQCYPDIAMSDSGFFVIAWNDERNLNSDIYAQRYDVRNLGYSLETNFRVDNDESGATQVWPSVAMNEAGDFVIAWNDERNPQEIYAQRYEFSPDTVVPMGTNFSISDPAYMGNLQTEVAVTMTSNKICYTWTDDRQGFLTDIFAKIADWTWSEVRGEEEIVNRPQSFELFQNYPNPFNPTTTIKFKVQGSKFKVPIHTTLNIYNILGRLVRTLVDEGKVPGEYQVIWDGKDGSGAEAASGVYFYQLKTADQSYTKKMVLMH